MSGPREEDICYPGGKAGAVCQDQEVSIYLVPYLYPVYCVTAIRSNIRPRHAQVVIT